MAGRVGGSVEGGGRGIVSVLGRVCVAGLGFMAMAAEGREDGEGSTRAPLGSADAPRIGKARTKAGSRPSRAVGEALSRRRFGVLVERVMDGTGSAPAVGHSPVPEPTTAPASVDGPPGSPPRRNPNDKAEVTSASPRAVNAASRSGRRPASRAARSAAGLDEAPQSEHGRVRATSDRVMWVPSPHPSQGTKTGSITGVPSGAPWEADVGARSSWSLSTFSSGWKRPPDPGISRRFHRLPRDQAGVSADKMRTFIPSERLTSTISPKTSP